MMPDPQASQVLGWEEAEKVRSPREEALTTNQFAALLIRTNYIKECGKLLPATWPAMTEAALTTHLTTTHAPAKLTQMFMRDSALRQALKNRARNFSIAAAVAVALIWCREDLEKGQYWAAGAKFTATVGGAIVLNRYFYGRDKTASRIMARNMGNWGKAFQGLARTNVRLNYLVRKLNPQLLLWEFRGLLTSSGALQGPQRLSNDFIVRIDIFDPSTWAAPPLTMLDLGFDFFYYQKWTLQWQVGAEEVPLGVINGTVLDRPKRFAKQWLKEQKAKGKALEEMFLEDMKILSRPYSPFSPF